MSKIPFINIADTNCWIVYMIPFAQDERGNYDMVNPYQQKCIQEKIFGMGWVSDEIKLSYGDCINDDNIKTYENDYAKGNPENAIRSALNDYSKMKKGDYVIMRGKNSHYYVGKLKTDPIFIHKQEEPYNRLSWGCEVDEWCEFKTDKELPSELVGRLSQKRHPTVQRISGYRLRLLTMAVYENHAKKKSDQFPEIPKLKISKNNFARSLDYMELEDLVSIYISNKHSNEGYRLLPSSCKISQVKYEFYFVANDKSPITCQVKNQQDINLNNYINEDAYEKVYIFSGKWSDEDVQNKRKECSLNPRLYIISPTELYNTLLSTSIFKNPYYLFSDKIKTADQLLLDDYIKCKKFNKSNSKKYSLSVDNEFACFNGKDGLFYSAEFEALILKNHIFEDRDIENEYIKQILQDINREIF